MVDTHEMGGMVTMHLGRRTICLWAVLVGVIVGVVFGATIPSAYAGTATSSPNYYGPYAGYTYWNQAIVTTYASGAYGGTHVQTYPGTPSVPPGYMGAVGKLYNSSGVLLLETGYSYNSVYASGMTVYTSTWTSHGTFYSRGWSRAWDGYSYHACQTYQSPYQTY